MALKNPAVPSIVLATTGGKVLMHHDGLIENLDGMLKKIREIHKEQ
jgi:hypothetical protein